LHVVGEVNVAVVEKVHPRPFRSLRNGVVRVRAICFRRPTLAMFPSAVDNAHDEYHLSPA